MLDSPRATISLAATRARVELTANPGLGARPSWFGGLASTAPSPDNSID